MISSFDLKRTLFRQWPVRMVLGLFFFGRGLFRLLLDPFQGMTDLCWVCRASRIGPLQSLAHRVLSRRFLADAARHNAIVDAYLQSAAPARTKRRFLPDGTVTPAFRDILVLKAPAGGEKGVLLLKYTAKFDLFVALFDLDRVMRDYYLVLEPCWSGYCDPSILMFISSRREVLVQCPDRADFEYIQGLGTNLVALPLGASDWVDADLFDGESRPKAYDLIMVANWGRRKNHRQLFRALRRVRRRPLSLLLVGYEWEGRTRADIERELGECRLDGISITIKERLPAHEVAEHLSQSRLFLLLSEKEGSNKALVEALFSNVPAIVYENFVGGAVTKVNPLTGVLSSFDGLAEVIESTLARHTEFAPREWALTHTGSGNATRVLNEALRRIAAARGETWTVAAVEKVNNPNLAYKIPGTIPPNQMAETISRAYLR